MATAQKINGRLAYADLLRVLAVIAAIVLHVSVAWLSQAGSGTRAATILLTYDALTRWCVPMFVMLSGMFLLDPQRSVRCGDIFLRYIPRVLLALLVWGSLYAFLTYGHQGWRVTWAGIKDALGHVLRADTHYHLWFLYVVIGLYLITPILRAFVRGASRADFHYFFLLAFVICSLLPTLQALWPSQVAIPMAWLDKMEIRLVLGYTGCYLAGYYLKAYTISRLAEFTIYLLGVLGTVVTVVSLHWGLRGALFQYYSPNVLLMAVAVFVLFRYVLGVSDERSRRQEVSGVARVSFGIFLVHVLFIQLFNWFGLTTLSFDPLISVPVLSAAVFLCSFAVAWLISKIPFLGRWLT